MTKKDLTREKALRLHYKMWTEMQEKLGDNPAPERRDGFKRNWCNEWSKNNNYRVHETVPVCSYCFLCEYAEQQRSKVFREVGLSIVRCYFCPIDWAKAKDIVVSARPFVTDCTDFYICSDDDYASPYYKFAPISKILAIPERSEAT